MKKNERENSGRRSDCPVSCTLELIGDKWSLLIIRDMMFLGKSTFNEFLESGEKISTNILSDRLVKLAEVGLITYSGTAKRKKYALTKMAADLKPVLDAIRKFGFKHFEGSEAYVEAQLKNLKGK